MEITFTLPVWLLWTFGVIIVLFILSLAAVGLFFIKHFRDFKTWK